MSERARMWYYSHDPRPWVTIYAVSREYGGPEEGGWYYDWWRVHRERGCWRMKSAEALRDKWDAEASEWQNRYDRYSVLGDEDYEVRVGRRRQYESTERPYYC